MKPEDHRILRARERYGIELTRSQISELERMVCADNCVRKQHGGGIHALLWCGESLIAGVIYNRDPPAICTFLPPDFFTSARRHAWGAKPKKVRRRIARRNGG